MRIVLVQPPSNYEETFLLSPPLGLLSVAAAAENEGAEVTLLDFNLKGLQDQRWQTAEYFYSHAVELIEKGRPDIVGFTSMAIESHVCLETARLLKERNPDIITLFGGPHFGAIATEVLEHYEWTDYVIAGEGEAPLQNLIRYLEGNDIVMIHDFNIVMVVIESLRQHDHAAIARTRPVLFRDIRWSCWAPACRSRHGILG